MKFIKHILFILFFLVFLSELIQNHKPWLKTKPLSGSFTTVSNPNFTLDTWLNGAYQEALMNYYENSLDIRSFLVRFRNQLDYFFFEKTKAIRVEVGKDKILFDNGYIKAFLGQDFVGEKEIIEKVNKLSFVQNELKKQNIDLIFVITPGKASFYPENLPSNYNLATQSRSNYDAYAEQFQKQEINYIDFRKFLLTLKPQAKFPLFPRCGVHWSGYCTTLAADTLFKYMEQLRKIDLVDYYQNGGEESSLPRNTDADIGDAMNLLYDIPSYNMYYPNIIFKKDDSTKTKPNVLIVGDSFVWTWISFYNYIPNLFNSETDYWYYNMEVAWPKNTEESIKVSELNLREQIKDRDFILMIFNEASLDKCGYGFIEQMFDLLHPDSSKN